MAAPADSRRSRDRGSITLWAVTSAFSMIAIVGIAADLGGHAVAEQSARSVAFEAARSGGQQLNLDLLARTGQAETDPYQAASAARAYLASAGVTGNVAVNGDSITVTVVDTYDCLFLTVIGFTSLPVSGQASADMIRVYEGTQR